MTDSRKHSNGMWKLGARVFVIRERHGWHDGRIEGIVTASYVNPRSPIGSCSFEVRTDEGETYEIKHARDLM